MTTQKARKLTTLTPKENRAWVFAFNFYQDEGLTEEQADSQVWRDLQLDFPRLLAFDGCRP